MTLTDQLPGKPDSVGGAADRKIATRAAQAAVLERAGIPDKGVTHYTLINGFAATVTPAQAAALVADPAVKAVVADSEVPVSAPSPTSSAGVSAGLGNRTPSVTPSTATPSSSALCPSSPSTPLLEPEALGIMHAASQDPKAVSAQTLSTGVGVTVAVLAESIDPNAPDFVRPDGSSAIVDYQNFSGVPDTAVGEAYGDEIFGDASSVAAQGLVNHDLSSFVNQAHPLPAGCNIRIKGVAPGASIVALKVLSSTQDDRLSNAVASNVVQAIDYAVTVDHVNVISESIGATSLPDTGSDVVQQTNDLAVSQGVSVVASAGDAGTTGTIGSPASDPLVISAAASTAERAAMQTGQTGTTLSNGTWVNGNIASFSSGGFTANGTVPVLTAPGDSGWAACTDKTDKPGCSSFTSPPTSSSIEQFGGTSQSAPFIAGTAALVIQAYRDSHGGATPTPAVIRQILTSSATDLGAPGEEEGAGQVDALAAVRTAAAVRTGRLASAPVAGGLLLSQDQFSDVAAQGATVTNTETVTNTGARAVTLNPSVRRLTAIDTPTYLSATLDPTKDPTAVGPTGVKLAYTKIPFTVQPNVDHVAISIAYPSATNLQSTAPQVAVALLNPSGAYVLSSRPQGGTTSSDFGNLSLSDPTPGQWTAVLLTPGFAGTVNAAVTQQRWTAAGTVTPQQTVVPAGGSVTLTTSAAVPTSSGDSTVSLTLGATAAASRTSVPIVERVLVGQSGGTGRFTGGVTGGNGRAIQPAQQQTYAFDVPAHKTTLDTSLVTSASAAIPRVRVTLISPNGQVQSTQNNSDQAGHDAATRTVANVVSQPAAGRWRLVVTTVSPSTGLDLVVPFIGTVSYDQAVATSAGFAALAPSQSLSAVPVDQNTVETVRISNPNPFPTKYYVDARTDTPTTVSLAPLSTDVPAAGSDLFGTGTLVPPDTTSVTATLSSAVPLQTQVSGPTAGLLLSGPDALGAAATPVNGVATSTAVLTVPTGTVTTGHYLTLAGTVGPSGPNGASTGFASGTLSATTLGFDSTVSTTGGDPFAPENANSSPPGITVPAGGSAAVNVTVRPTASIGSTVSGVINVVQAGTDSSVTRYIAPAQVSTYQTVAAFPYRYKVSPKAVALTGMVTSAAGPVPGVDAIAYSTSGVPVDHSRTDTKGRYAIGGLPAGRYSICFDTGGVASPAPTGYLDSCLGVASWDGVSPPPAGTTQVVVTAGVVANAPTARLAVAAGAHGRAVYYGGAPAANVAAYVFDATGVPLATTSTDTQGRYSFSGLAATNVFVCLIPPFGAGPNGGYSAECNGQTWNEFQPVNQAGLTTVHLTLGQFTTVDATIQSEGLLRGTVSDSSGAGVDDPSAAVWIVPSKDTNFRNSDLLVAPLTSEGGYGLAGMTPGKYWVCYSGVRYQSQCYKEQIFGGYNSSIPAASTPVPVALNATTTIDFTVTPVAGAAAKTGPDVLRLYLDQLQAQQQQHAKLLAVPHRP